MGISLLFSPSLLQAAVVMLIGSSSYFLVSVLVAAEALMRDLLTEALDEVKRDVYRVLRENWRKPLSSRGVHVKLRAKGRRNLLA